MYKILEDERVFIDYGPIQLSIDCRIDDVRCSQISVKVADEVLAEFNRLIPFTEQLKQMRRFDKTNENLPSVLNKMIYAVDRTEYDELNTLAAVAGSFSEYALDVGKSLGATKIIINNGGDIAIYNKEASPIKVAIPINDNESLKFSVDKSMKIGGICTSGLQGRSFSKGIATFATVLAQKASIADACATYIANMTNEEHPNIIRCKAEEIDEGTDIRGQTITLKILDVPNEIKYKALLNGYDVAYSLYKKGIILGAVICIDENIITVAEDLKIER